MDEVKKTNMGYSAQSSQQKWSNTDLHAPDCKQSDTKQRRERNAHHGTRRCANPHHDNTTEPQHSTQRRRPTDESKSRKPSQCLSR